MTSSFFLYVIWFNPGQSFEYYSLLQHSPPLTQNAKASLGLHDYPAAFAQLNAIKHRIEVDGRSRDEGSVMGLDRKGCVVKPEATGQMATGGARGQSKAVRIWQRPNIGSRVSRTVGEAGINRLSPSGHALLLDRKLAEPGPSGRAL
jgi:hypothetical protein